MVTQSRIWFKDVMNFNFKIIRPYDKVFFNQHGYDYFIVEKYLTKDKNIMIEWSCEDRTCRLLKIDKRGTILKNYPIAGYDELQNIIAFFKWAKKHKKVIKKAKKLNCESILHFLQEEK